MTARRILVSITAAVLAISLSGCSGWLRSISSDNKVTSRLDDNGYYLDTRDFTLTLPGEWDWLRDDGVITLPGAPEYNVGVVNPDGISIQARGELKRGDASDCAVWLGRELPELGWGVDGRFDESIEINGQDAARVRAGKTGQQLNAFCFRSEQGAVVQFFVMNSGTAEWNDVALLESALNWK